MNSEKRIRNTRMLFVIYLLLLSWAIVCKFRFIPVVMSTRSINLIPLAGSFRRDGSFFWAEFLFNILAFLPFGVYLSETARSLTHFRRVLIFSGISLLYEVVQFAFCVGVADITDVLTNTLGGFLGMSLYAIVQRFLCVEAQRLARAINIAQMTGVFTIAFAYTSGALVL